MTAVGQLRRIRGGRSGTRCMVRPCVARVFVDLAVSGLASMYPAFRLERVVLRAIMDISARAISLADRPRPGHSGHQCSHALGRPNLHLFSSSRRPRRLSGGFIELANLESTI